MIYPNQILFVPLENPSCLGKTYETVEGDTINQIISKSGLSYQTLNKMNSLHDLLLTTNQVIYLDTCRDTYVVKNGDTLDSISLEYGVNISELVGLNNLLVPGTKLRIK